jgi:hypothetical protein
MTWRDFEGAVVARTSGLKPCWLWRVLPTLGGADGEILAKARWIPPK